MSDETTIVTLDADVAGYVEKMNDANQADLKRAKAIEDAVDGFDKLKSAGDKVLGVLERMGPVAKATAERIKLMPDAADRAQASIKALDDAQSNLAGPKGLSNLNSKLSQAGAELNIAKAAAGPFGVAIAGVTAITVAGAAAFAKYTIEANIAFLESTPEGKRQIAAFDAAAAHLNVTIGESVNKVTDLGDVMEGVAAQSERAANSIAGMTDEQVLLGKESALFVVENALPRAFGDIIRFSDKARESLAKQGAEARELREGYLKVLEVTRKLREENAKDAKNEQKGFDEEEAARRALGIDVPDTVTPATGTKKKTPRGGGGGARSKPKAGPQFGPLQTAQERQGFEKFTADRKTFSDQADTKAGLEPLTEQMNAQAKASKTLIEQGNALAEAYVKGADQGLDAMNSQLETYNERIAKAGELTGAVTGLIGDQVQALASGEGGFAAFGDAAKAMTADILSSEGDAAIAKGSIMVWTNPAAGLGYIGAGLAAKAVAGAISPGSGGGGASSAGAAARPSPASIPDLQNTLAGTGTPQRNTTEIHLDGRRIAESMDPVNEERARLGQGRRRGTTRRAGAVRR